ncbi:MAG: UDP-glucose 4-epimerase GalE [Nitrospirota bacterium]
MKLFITGGAGYIGSHVVKLLGEKGHEILVYDDLSSGHEWAVLFGTLVKGSLADTLLLQRTLQSFQPDAVLHFAAYVTVGESVKEPLKYYQNNTGCTLQLLDAMIRNHVFRLIFSSSATVYGLPTQTPVNETTPLCPINPYGSSKAMVEHILQGVSAVSPLRYISLRYFNAAGADPSGIIGPACKQSSRLITRALKTAKGEFEKLFIYGSDYPTHDGTCVRDYIHVDDLSEAHVLALHYLSRDAQSDVFNCGYGHGHSVKEVIKIVKKVTGVDFLVEEADRRPGDPSILIADNAKIQSQLGWKPRFDDLEYIIETAWKWVQKYRGN